jgi:hypothetical protein
MARLTYENIWVRNAGLFAFMTGLTLLDYQLNPLPNEPALPLTLLSLLAIYLLLFLHNVVLLQHFLLKQRYLSYTLLLFVYLLGHSAIAYFFGAYVAPDEPASFASEVIGAFLLVAIGSGFYFTHLWILTNLVKTKKRMLHTETELALLKQQMNPHFLLNALNNLYGVSLAAPGKVPDKILELSELLTYQVETSKKDWISLQEEMDFADKYLHYMEWKTNGMKVKMNIAGEVLNYRLTPMIFLPLLENAVKYASETPEPTIAVDWSFEHERLLVTVTNNFKPALARKESTRTGIDNLKRRLELYHPQHKLTLLEDKDQFTARLEIWNMYTVA